MVTSVKAFQMAQEKAMKSYHEREAIKKKKQEKLAQEHHTTHEGNVGDKIAGSVKRLETRIKRLHPKNQRDLHRKKQSLKEDLGIEDFDKAMQEKRELARMIRTSKTIRNALIEKEIEDSADPGSGLQD